MRHHHDARNLWAIAMTLDSREQYTRSPVGKTTEAGLHKTTARWRQFVRFAIGLPIATRVVAAAATMMVVISGLSCRSASNEGGKKPEVASVQRHALQGDCAGGACSIAIEQAGILTLSVTSNGFLAFQVTRLSFNGVQLAEKFGQFTQIRLEITTPGTYTSSAECMAGTFCDISASWQFEPGFIEFPQYIGARKSAEGWNEEHKEANKLRCNWPSDLPFYGSDNTCVTTRPDLTTFVPDQPKKRRQILQRAFREVADEVLGSPRRVAEAPGRRLATSVIIYLMEIRDASQLWTFSQYVDDVLAAAYAERMPIIFQLEPVYFNGNNTVLDDLNNVESTADGTPVQQSWVNWGKQIRWGHGAPNLMAPGVRAYLQQALLTVLPKIGAYYAGLKPEEKYLFGGVVFGMELSVGIHNWYYPNGNNYRTTPAECDPGTVKQEGENCPGVPLVPGQPVNQGIPTWYHISLPRACNDDGQFAQSIGYRGAAALGLPTATHEQMKAVAEGSVQDLIGFFNHWARASGLPTHKLLSHVLPRCKDDPAGLWVGRLASVVPGWSLYSAQSRQPYLELYLGPYLNDPSVSALPWASPEWQERPVDDVLTALRDTASFRNNRMVMYANWETGKTSEGRDWVSAFTTAMTDDPQTVSPAVDLGHATFRNGAGQVIAYGIKISTPFPHDARTYLNVSTSSALSSSGTLQTVDVSNQDVTGLASVILGPGNGDTVYVQLVTDAVIAGDTKRIQSPVVPLVRPVGVARDILTAGWPRLFVRSEGGHVTWSFDTGHLTEGSATYLNVTTDPSFAQVNAVNANVTGTDYYTSTLSSGQTYYARIVTDDVGSGLRRISNIEVVTPSETRGAIRYPRFFVRSTAAADGGTSSVWSWDVGDVPSGSRAYLNVSTDSSFNQIDVANEDVTGVEFREIHLTPGRTLYGRVISDVLVPGGVERRVSVVESISP